jgi:hypothetical protein
VREGVFRCGAQSLSCSLLDLPHNVETFITSDNVNFYKVRATHAHAPRQRALLTATSLASRPTSGRSSLCIRLEAAIRPSRKR